MNHKRNRNVNCIIPAYNVGRYLDEAIQSVINQTVGFDTINLVIVNDGSDDNTEEVILSYQSRYDNIFYIYQENQGVSAARNAGLAYCENFLSAPYTCFLDGDDKYDTAHVEVTTNFLDNRLNQFGRKSNKDEHGESSTTLVPDAVFLPIKLFEKEDSMHFAYQVIDRGETRIIDFSTSPLFFSHVNSAMFRTQAIQDERFDEQLQISEDAQFLIKILLKTNCAGWINDDETFYYLRKRLDESSVIDNADSNPALYERIKIYKKEFENYLMLCNRVPRLVQSSVLYDIHWFKSLDNDPKKYQFPFNVDQALEEIKYVIQQIDDDLLEQEYIPYWYRAYFKQMKYGDFHIVSLNNNIEPNFFCGDRFFEPVAGTIQIQWITQTNNQLTVKGFFVKPNYSGIKLLAIFKNKKIEVDTKYSFHNDKKYYLGHEIFPAMDFEITVNLRKLSLNRDSTLSFYFEYENQLIPTSNIEHGWTSRFYDGNKIFIGENIVIEDTDLWNGFSIKKINGRKTIEKSLLPYKDFFEDSYLLSRFIEYYKKYRKKRIWLFIDRPTAIGDNAEALFRYSIWKKDGIEKFMVVPDANYIEHFTGMKAKIIIFGSFEYKFLLMFAEKVISSITFFEFINVETNISGQSFKKIAQALASSQQIFLQHGITKDYGIINNYLNSSMREIDLLITATQKETDLFLSPEAGFNTNQVKLTGFPRYDVLKSNSEKIITFIPTWRNRYSHDDDSYNLSFKYSDLYFSISSFLTNEKLIQAIKKYGYKLIFKVHPKMQVQLEDFSVSEEVQIVCNEISYKELYEKSSVMITDYSSAVFDFAYLKKPVIYCQTVEPEHEQDEDLFSYKKDGFGEVFDNQEDAIEYLCALIQTDFQMTENYQKRVNDFFIYKDTNNCERVYKEMQTMPRRIKFAKLRWIISKSISKGYFLLKKLFG